MALDKDFLKRAKRDTKAVSDEIKKRIEEDDPEDSGEVKEVVAAAPEKAVETPPKEKPTPAPEAKAKPVESTPAPKPEPKVEPEKEPDKVPVHLLVDQRKRADAAERALESERREREDLRRKLDEASKPKEVEKPKAPEDPEPDPKTHPIEHSEWEAREMRRENAQLRKEVGEIRSSITERTQREEEVRMRGEIKTTFNGLLEAAAQGAAPERVPHIADIREREAFVREKQYRMNLLGGMDDATAKAIVDDQLIVFLGQQFAAKRNPIQSLADIAETWGYTPKPAEAAPEAKPTITNGNGKSATDRIRDQRERESASRTTSTMPGAAPRAADDGKMDAVKWGKMSPKERKEYRKANPTFKVDDMMAAADA